MEILPGVLGVLGIGFSLGYVACAYFHSSQMKKNYETVSEIHKTLAKRWEELGAQTEQLRIARALDNREEFTVTRH